MLSLPPLAKNFLKHLISERFSSTDTESNGKFDGVILKPMEKGSSVKVRLPSLKNDLSKGAEEEEEASLLPAKERTFSGRARKEREIKLKDFKVAIDVAETIGNDFVNTKSLFKLSTRDNYRVDSISNTKLFWTDEKGKVVLWNEEMVKCTSIPACEALGKPLQDLVHPNYRAEVLLCLESITRTEAPPTFKICFQSQNRVKHTILHAAPRRANIHTVIGGLFIAEEVLSNHFDPLYMRNGSGEGFQRLLFGVNVKVFGIDSNMRFDVWNEKISSASGYSPDAILGTSIKETVFCVDMEGFEPILQAALAGQETCKYELTCCISEDHSAKNVVEVDVLSRKDSNGNVIGVLCVGLDHTADDEKSEALESAKKALSRAMEQLKKEKRIAAEAGEKEARSAALLDMKRRFVRGVGHEIRTPLNVVYAGLQLLETKLEGIVDIDILDIILDLKQSCRDAVDILDDLLSYEKIDSNLLLIEKTPLDIRSFVKESLRPFAVQARLSQVSIRYFDTSVITSEGGSGRNLAETLGPMVDVDKHKVGQVLRNLISNAVKFSKSGEVIDVKVSWRKECSNPDSAKPEVVAAADYGWVRVEVQDSGPGISLPNQKKLFNSIVQFNPKLLQDGGGSGIGLWVSKGIIDLHGGVIGVESQGEGFGSTFFFEIPALKTDYDPSLDGPLHVQCPQRAISSLRCDQVSSMGMAVSVSTDSALLQLHALIVDDSRLCRTMLRRILSDVCDVMEEAADGNEAVNKVALSMRSSRPYDVVLMDGHMPGMDGTEACSIMREQGFKGKIIGVTGDVQAEDINNFKCHGADIVLPKPIDIRTLHDYISGVFVCFKD